ncbi:MAG: hypothetical protein ACI8X5_002094 [Planctomycetota bacterium]|jgi:hypothetical protein
MRSRPDTIREYELGDEPAILRAFNQANAAHVSSFQARSIEQWRWRYLENPAGLRVTLAFDNEGQVLAQYAGSPQRMRLDGAWTHVTQGIDSFSAVSTRGLGHRGTFVRTGELFAEVYGARAGAGDPYMWGFPVPIARRVGERFLGYEALRSQVILELSANTSLAPGESATDFGEGPLQASAHEFEGLFERCAEGKSVFADRRSHVLDWRYRKRPGVHYEIGLARTIDGDLCGFAVYRTGEFEGERAGLIVDWLAEPEAEAALARWATSHAQAAGVNRLVHLLPPTCASFITLQELGFRVRPMQAMLVGRTYDEDYPLSFWSENWYYTLGDTDLC